MAFLFQMFPITPLYLENTHEGLKNDPALKSLTKQLAAKVYDKVVIAGPDRADKTALVFQAAVSAAFAGARVAHICTHPLRKMPTQVHGMPDPKPSTMKMVDFLYFETCSELITWCSNIHTKSKLPDLIIIEDILSYASQLNENQIEKSLSRLSATIADTISWIGSKNCQGGCQVILTGPTRIQSLSSVLALSHFQMVTYQGPSKDEVNSKVSFRSKDSLVDVQFCKEKDVLMLKSVYISLQAT